MPVDNFYTKTNKSFRGIDLSIDANLIQQFDEHPASWWDFYRIANLDWIPLTFHTHTHTRVPEKTYWNGAICGQGNVAIVWSTMSIAKANHNMGMAGVFVFLQIDALVGCILIFRCENDNMNRNRRKMKCFVLSNSNEMISIPLYHLNRIQQFMSQ